jgi:hypothetical protein
MPVALVVSTQARTVRGRAGRSVTWYMGLGSLPDGPRVRRGGEGRRRRLDLAPGRDPVGEERS